MKTSSASGFTGQLVMTGIGPNLVFGIDISVPDSAADPNNIYIGQTAPPLMIEFTNTNWQFTANSHNYRIKITNKTTGATPVNTVAVFSINMTNLKARLSYPWTAGAMAIEGTYYYQFSATSTSDGKVAKFPRMVMRVRKPV